MNVSHRILLITILLLSVSVLNAQQAWRKIINEFGSNAIEFVDIQNGWIAYEDLYKTTNQGLTWEKQELQLPAGINNVQWNNLNFFNDRYGVISSEELIGFTDDGGYTWEIGFTPNRINCIDSWVVDENNIVILAEKDIYKSTDKGHSWIKTYTSPEQNRNVFFLNSQKGWVVTDKGYLLKTLNGGDSWSLSLVASGDLRAIHFLDGNTGFLCGSNGIFLKTSNGGDNWIESQVPTQNDYKSIRFLNAQYGFVVGGRYISLTTDGGGTWMHSTRSGEDYQNIYTFDNLKYLVTSLNGLLKYTSESLSLIKPVGGEVLESESQFEFEWISDGMYKIDIEYSMNAGRRWHTLASDLPTYPGKIELNLPKGLSSEVIFKIAEAGTNTTNPISDISGDPITLYYNGDIINVPFDTPSIQGGIDIASNGDTIIVSEGLYYENINLNDRYGLVIKSTYGPDATILDGREQGTVITIDGGEFNEICGFTVQNGSGVSGGAVFSNRDNNFENMIIKNNFATRGGGFYFKEGMHSVIKNSVIYNNSAKFEAGGGIYVIEDCRVRLENSQIINNTAKFGAGIFSYSSGIQILNSLIQHNTASDIGGGIWSNSTNSGDSLIIYNSKIIENTAESVGGVYLTGYHFISQQHEIYNTVFSENVGGALGVQSASASIGKCVFYNNIGCVNAADHCCSAIYFENSESVVNNCSFNFNISEDGSCIQCKQNNSFDKVPTITGCNFNNNESAINNDSYGAVIIAENNWWGDPSGPYHPSQNTDGIGDSTNVYVDVTPYLTSANNDAPPLQVSNVRVNSQDGSKYEVTWDPVPIDDLAGYMLYYSSDSTRWNFSDSIDVGPATSYELENFNLGSKYFISITCYDIDGNNSWFSAPVNYSTRTFGVRNLVIGDNEDPLHLTSSNPVIEFDLYDSMGESSAFYDLQISDDSLFTTPEMLNISGEINSNISIPYSGEALLKGEMYFIRIRIRISNLVSSWRLDSLRLNSKPSIPMLISPKNEDIVTDSLPTIMALSSIDKENDEIYYNLQLSTDSNFTKIYTENNELMCAYDTLMWTVDRELLDNQVYYYRARAYDGFEYSSYSNSNLFFTNITNTPPLSFSLLKPLHNEIVTQNNVTFEWESAQDNDPGDSVNYLLIIYPQDSDTITFNVGPDTTFVLQSGLLDRTQYYWEVIATDLVGSKVSNEGSKWSFTTKIEIDPPSDFSLNYPQDGATISTLKPTFSWTESNDTNEGDTINYRINIILKDIDTLTFNNLSDTNFVLAAELEDNSEYYWTVIASNQSGVETQSSAGYWSFKTNQQNDKPSQFLQLSPQNMVVLKNLTPLFQWYSSVDPDPEDTVTYKLAVCASNGKDTTYNIGTDTVFIPNRNLDDNLTFNWWVIANDKYGDFTVSDTLIFFTDVSSEPPNSFNLIYPPTDTSNIDSEITFRWHTADDNDPLDSIYYKLFVSTDSLFNLGVSNYITEDTTITLGFSRNTYYWFIEAIDNDSLSVKSSCYSFTVGDITDVSANTTIEDYKLFQNFPNPFNPNTIIKYALPEKSNIGISIFDINGQEVYKKSISSQPSGYYYFNFNASAFSSGVYICVLEAESIESNNKFRQVNKMMLLK